MATTHNLEQQHVAKAKERRDNADGWDRGYDTPYPPDKEEAILANIMKVSPAFVAGYREARARIAAEDWAIAVELERHLLDELDRNGR